jgi:hypothetical protein
VRCATYFAVGGVSVAFPPVVSVSDRSAENGRVITAGSGRAEDEGLADSDFGCAAASAAALVSGVCANPGVEATALITATESATKAIRGLIPALLL